MDNLTANQRWLTPMPGLSPAENLGRLDPGIRIDPWVGSADVVRPPLLSENYADDARQIGKAVSWQLVEDGDHDTILSISAHKRALIARWARSYDQGLELMAGRALGALLRSGIGVVVVARWGALLRSGICVSGGRVGRRLPPADGKSARIRAESPPSWSSILNQLNNKKLFRTVS